MDDRNDLLDQVDEDTMKADLILKLANLQEMDRQ